MVIYINAMLYRKERNRGMIGLNEWMASLSGFLLILFILLFIA